MYGPTETTVWSTCCLLTEIDKPISIGNPIANTQVYILDSNLQRCLWESPVNCTSAALAWRGVT